MVKVKTKSLTITYTWNPLKMSSGFGPMILWYTQCTTVHKLKCHNDTILSSNQTIINLEQ